MSGRKKPYTAKGIKRLKCTRCSEPATQQWRICADGLWRPICRDCDLILNRIALRFMFPGDLVENMVKMEYYIRSLGEGK